MILNTKKKKKRKDKSNDRRCSAFSRPIIKRINCEKEVGKGFILVDRRSKLLCCKRCVQVKMKHLKMVNAAKPHIKMASFKSLNSTLVLLEASPFLVGLNSQGPLSHIFFSVESNKNSTNLGQ